MKRLVQIRDEGTEELWNFPEEMEDQPIRNLWRAYVESDFDSFQSFIEELCPEVEAERVFVDEIYV
jgi:hypothetical protein